MLAKKFSYIVRDPRNINRLLSLIIRVECLRDFIAHVIKVFKPRALPVELDQGVMRHYQEITQIGYSKLPRLSAQQLSDIHNYLKDKALYIRFMHGKGASYTYDSIPQGINMLEYDALTVAKCPHL